MPVKKKKKPVKKGGKKKVKARKPKPAVAATEVVPELESEVPGSGELANDDEADLDLDPEDEG